ncbi:imelysin family protein [Actibacterium sp. MT2.3-13A]|uniref:imelysin family protein n=1 Tax=Actibacterium sp. MT2.3-13A TaxID=2828332 RepID=UPI001BA85D56|nr:imelysin family protein [Actibacterium sp. MT2.3-13A]
MRLALCLCAALAASPAAAGVEEALAGPILPGLAAFAGAAEDLAEAARADCRADALAPDYHAAFDAWMAVGDIRLGPSETGALAIAFWPDDRGFTARTLNSLIAQQDPVADDAAAFAEVSIAARGLFALDMLLFDETLSAYGPDDYACRLVRALTADLAGQAGALEAAWRESFAQSLRTAGAAGNATFLSPDEAVRALYTQILSGLEFTADSRIGRPMGSFARPRPKRAEAWRSGRSLRNVLASVEASAALARALAGRDLPETDAALARVRVAAGRIGDPGFQDLADPAARLKAEILQQEVRGVKAAIEAELGAQLGIAPGFNAQDGD